MGYISGEDRKQVSFEPICLDDYVSQDNISRIIDIFCDKLDMEGLGFRHAQTLETGRPPYDPKMLLKLYLYGYLNRISSSGMLAREATRNIEVMWLTGKLEPKKRTLCYFKEQNTEAIKKVFREFNLLYKQLGLFGGETIAVDSVKIRANNSKHNNYCKAVIEQRLKEAEEGIAKYFAMLAENDASEAEEVELSADAIKKAIEKLTEKKAKYEALQQQLEESGDNEISTVDGDSRMMRQGSGKGLDVSYNTQVATDDKNKMIIVFETTNQANDFSRLSEMTESAKEFLCVDEITALADSGYYNTDDILKCEENGTTCLVPPMTDPGRKAPDEAYHRSNFEYNPESDVFVCPEGQELHYMAEIKAKGGRKVRQYRNEAACRKCPNKDKCTKGKEGRTVTRAKEQDKIDALNKRFAERHDEYKRRMEIVEHPFGTIKWVWGFNRYQTRGFAKVGAENALIFCAYNLRRAVNILGTEKLLEAMATIPTIPSQCLCVFHVLFALRRPCFSF
jgi:transposase